MTREEGIEIHGVQNEDGKWIHALMITANRLRKSKGFKNFNGEDGWYWAVENDPQVFNGPFDTAELALMACVDAISGRVTENSIYKKTAKVVTDVQSLDNETISSVIHHIEDKNGSITKVAVVHSDEINEGDVNKVPVGWYWASDRVKSIVRGPFDSANYALLGAVKDIQGDEAAANAVALVLEEHNTQVNKTLH